MKHTIFSSNGECLKFQTAKEYKDYKEAINKVTKWFYQEQVRKYGVYASNQDTFVKDRSEFNSYDSTYMEDHYGVR